jgi:hypothetical protein
VPNIEGFAALNHAAAPNAGVFLESDARSLGISAHPLTDLHRAGVVERLHPRVSRFNAVAPSPEQALRAPLLWAGPSAAAGGRSAGQRYGLEDVVAPAPEIVAPADERFVPCSTNWILAGRRVRRSRS